MSRLPNLSGGAVVRRLERAGFVVVRIRGSHHRLAHADGRSTTVPVRCEMTRDEFEALA